MSEPELSAAVRQLGQSLKDRGWTLGVAESLTGGQLAATIARGPDASDWLRGALVAYQSRIKRNLLGVPDGPVVSERCARAMARGIRELLNADVGIAVTGVGGPGSDEGQPAGTVWAAVSTPESETAHQARFFDQPPEVVCSLSCSLGVDLVLRVLNGVAGIRLATP